MVFLIFENKDIRGRFVKAFPMFYINHNLEAIVYPRANTYFMLEDVQTETDLAAKVLEWLSREAAKGVSKRSRDYHLSGINTFLGTDFTQDDMLEIYTYLGNRINHAKTLAFISSDYDFDTLRTAVTQ